MMNIPGQNIAQTSLATEVKDESLMLDDQTDEMLTPEELRQISGGAIVFVGGWGASQYQY
uniref:Uncharacterized protein n=1 Tax=Cyanothece sp. (strain PCC 7425 / ATCC 29141) TaxID=395961 RepID=B8HZ60_CYAP4